MLNEKRKKLPRSEGIKQCKIVLDEFLYSRALRTDAEQEKIDFTKNKTLRFGLNIGNSMQLCKTKSSNLYLTL